MIWTTLLPQNPSYHVFHEGGSIGQYRIELNTSGSAESYFLSVLQFAESGVTSLNFVLKETDSEFQVILDSNYQGT